MIKKFFIPYKHNDLTIDYIEKINVYISTIISKNDLPTIIKYEPYTMNVEYCLYELRWIKSDNDYRDNDLASYIHGTLIISYTELYKNKIDTTYSYKKYKNFYKYNGYSLNYFISNFKCGKSYKFVRGICLDQLKRDVETN